MIVGAGAAGISCARRLSESGQPFLLVTEDIGGRIRRSRDGLVNLGAYYVRGDYEHSSQIVLRGRRIRASATRLHEGEGSYSYADARALRYLPQGARFLRRLIVFRRHYRALKANCLNTSQAEAIRADRLLWHLYEQPASEFVKEHRIEGLAARYLEPGVRGTTFQPLRNLTALVMLLASLPILEPTYEFRARPGVLEGEWARDAIRDTATGITRSGDGYRVETKRAGSILAAQVVVATPPEVSRRLLALSRIKTGVTVHSFEMKGVLRPRWAASDINLFGDDSPTYAIARQRNGSILFCSGAETPDFDLYFARWEVVEHRHWSPAFNLIGNTLLECEQAPGLYLIGDHNICGLEDAYITGIYAANQIVRRQVATGTRLPATP